MKIEELNLKPHTLYAVYDANEEFSRLIQTAAEQGLIDLRGSSFIYLRPEQRIEELTDERLAEVGLCRVKSVST